MSESGLQETNIIFLFCVSNDADFAYNHMCLLAELAGKLGNNNRVRLLQTAKTKKEIIDILLNDPEPQESSDSGEIEIDLDINLM